MVHLEVVNAPIHDNLICFHPDLTLVPLVVYLEIHHDLDEKMENYDFPFPMLNIINFEDE
jgi:hypothetical protein